MFSRIIRIMVMKWAVIIGLKVLAKRLLKEK